MSQSKIYTVTALNDYVNGLLKSDTNLINIQLKGEASGVTYSDKGHIYFDIKDDKSVIKASLFASNVRKMGFVLKDGAKVVVEGSVSIFSLQGKYQIIVESIKEDGKGDAYLKLMKLTEELYKEGYIDNEEHRRKLKKYPKRVGVITSKNGAAIDDVRRNIKKINSLVEVVLYHASVQGDTAVSEIVSQIELANKENKVDTLIVTRGGGSVEDLGAFNEKEIVLAVFNSKIPVISAVGHERDWSLCDRAADLRVSTPTAVAEAVTASLDSMIKEIERYMALFDSDFRTILHDKTTKINNVEKNLLYNSPKNKVDREMVHYNNLLEKLGSNFGQIIEYKNLIMDKLTERTYNDIENVMKNKIQAFGLCNASLKNLNPLAIMEKGFSVVLVNEKIVKSVKDVKKDDVINIKVTDGDIKAKVE